MKHKKESPQSNENLAQNTQEPLIKEEFIANEPSIIQRKNEENNQNLLKNNKSDHQQDKEQQHQNMSPNIRNNIMNLSENTSNANMSSIFLNATPDNNRSFIDNQIMMRNLWLAIQTQNYLKNVKNLLVLNYLRQLSSIC